jgi:hypothetical protein
VVQVLNARGSAFVVCAPAASAAPRPSLSRGHGNSRSKAPRRQSANHCMQPPAISPQSQPARSRSTIQVPASRLLISLVSAWLAPDSANAPSGLQEGRSGAAASHHRSCGGLVGAGLGAASSAVVMETTDAFERLAILLLPAQIGRPGVRDKPDGAYAQVRSASNRSWGAARPA